MRCWWGHQRDHAHQPNVTRFWHLILALFKVHPRWRMSKSIRNPICFARFPLQEKSWTFRFARGRCAWGQRLINRKSDCRDQEEAWNLQLPNRFLSSARFGIPNSAMWGDFTQLQSGTCSLTLSFQTDIDWPQCYSFDCFWWTLPYPLHISVTVTSNS